jgi:hypothetical protein
MKVKTMSNLDRFARPLDSERVGGYWLQQVAEEQRELNKKNMVDNYISVYFNATGLKPCAEYIQEKFYQVDLDLDMIQERINAY